MQFILKKKEDKQMVKIIQPVYSDDDIIFNRFDIIYQEKGICVEGG